MQRSHLTAKKQKKERKKKKTQGEREEGRRRGEREGSKRACAADRRHIAVAKYFESGCFNEMQSYAGGICHSWKVQFYKLQQIY